MDIQLRDLNDQVSPQPWVARQAGLPLEELIRADWQQHPEATPDEIVQRLAQQNIQAPGIYVATLLAKWR